MSRLLVVFRKAVGAITFDETLHPRHPAGSSRGGQFSASNSIMVSSAFEARLAHIMGVQEFAEHRTIASALETALGYLREDGDREGAEELVSLFREHLAARGHSEGAADALQEYLTNEWPEEDTAVPALPEWAAPVAEAPDGNALLRAAKELFLEAPRPVAGSSWLLPSGLYINMVDEHGNAKNHESIGEAFAAAGQPTQTGVGYLERFALRAGALRVYLPDCADEGPTTRRVHVTRVDAGMPVTDAQVAALRRLLHDSEYVTIERQVLQAAGRPELGQAWLTDTRGEGDEARRAIGHGLRLLREDCRTDDGRTRSPSPVGAGGRLRERGLRDIRKSAH